MSAFSNVFTKTLHDLRRGLVGWSIGIVALVAMMVAVWPTIRDMDVSGFVEQYPEAMRELFNIDQLATGPGFLNAELFSSLLPILFISYGVGVGARIMAREEESGTLDVLLSTPLSRTALMAHKGAAVFIAITGLGFVLALSTWLMAAPMDMGVSLGYAASASLAMVLIGLLYAGIAFGVAAVTGSRGRAIAVSGTLAVAGYAFYVAAAIVDGLAEWVSITPFQHAIGIGPASTGLGALPVGFLWLAIAAVAVVLAANPAFTHRDVGG